MRISEIYESNDYIGLAKYLLSKGFVSVGETEVPSTHDGYGHQTRHVTTTYELVGANYEVYLKIEKYLGGKIKKHFTDVYGRTRDSKYKPLELSYRNGPKDRKTKISPFIIVAKVTTEEDAHSPADRPSMRIPYLHGPFTVGDKAKFSKGSVAGWQNMGIIGAGSSTEDVTIKAVNGDGTYEVQSDEYNARARPPFTASDEQLSAVVKFYSGAEFNKQSKFNLAKFNSLTDFTHYRLAHDERGTATLTGVNKSGQRCILDTGYVDQILRKFIDSTHNHTKRIPKEEWWNTLSDAEKADYTAG